MTDPFLGNAAVVERLEGKLRAGRLPHALIFSGPEGVGKRTFAVRLIQTMNCEGTGETACGECISCGKFERGTHPELSEISVEDGATQIKIEQIRSLRDRLELAPAGGRVRAWIIDPAERLSPGAANALLKVLEEPPPKTYFFLIATNAAGLLVTIRSRCQIYHFAPLPIRIVKEMGVSDDLVARWSAGSIGWVRRSDPAEVRRMRDEMLDFLETGFSGDPAVWARRIGVRLVSAREEFPELIRATCFLISDLMHLKLGLSDSVVNLDVADRLDALARQVEIADLVSAGREIRLLETRLKYHLNNQLLTDDLLTSLGREAMARKAQNSE